MRKTKKGKERMKPKEGGDIRLELNCDQNLVIRIRRFLAGD